MAENVIDTLKLDIIVNTKQNGQSITTLRNSLEKLYKFLNGVKDQDFSKISNDIAKIGGRLTPLVNAINSLDGQGLKNLTSLGTRLQTLNKRMGEIDAKAMAHKFDQMTQAITPFIDKVMSAQEALVALNNVMGGAKTLTKTATPKATTTTTPKATSNTTILGGNLGKSLNLGSMIAKLYFVRNITKQLGQNLAKVVQYGIDYEETLNLWQVAMKGNTAEARKFITEMNRAYGISEITLMNYQATFKNMLSSLGGINQEVAYGLSETLSQMALDYASLYNTSIESAMTKFQAVLAGQVRPIRSESGYDITQATLYEVYKDIGGTKSVRQLSETEKRLLRILAVYRQMKDTAVGDYAKTIYSTANQTRFMSETIKDIATWIGVGANQWLKQSGVLIRINAYLLALKELAKSFAISMGYVEVSEEKAQDPLGDIEQGWNDINKQVDEYQGKLLGFDKFQVLTSAGTDGADIPAELLKAMQEYESILGKSQNVALFGDTEKNIKGAYDILKDLGFVYDEQSGQWLKDGKTVKEILQEIWTTIKGIFTFVGLMTKPWLVLVFAIEEAYWKNEDFRNSVNTMLKQLGGAGLKVFQELAEIFIDIAPVLVKIVEGFAGIIGWLDEMELLDDVIWLVVGALIAWKTVNIVKSITETYKLLQPMITKLQGLATQFTLTQVAAAGMAVFGFMVAYDAAKNLFSSWDDMSGLERAIEIFKLLAGAAMVAAVAIGVFHTSWSVGVAAGVITAGIALLMGYMASIKSQTNEIGQFANGGLATKGSLFYAGEAGPELVTQTSGGGSTIMNMKQLEDAVARGMIRGAAATQGNEGQQITVNVSGKSLFSILVDEAKSNGYELVKVR
jgi:hypothetical protein